MAASDEPFAAIPSVWGTLGEAAKLTAAEFEILRQDAALHLLDVVKQGQLPHRVRGAVPINPLVDPLPAGIDIRQHPKFGQQRVVSDWTLAELDYGRDIEVPWSLVFLVFHRSIPLQHLGELRAKAAAAAVEGGEGAAPAAASPPAPETGPKTEGEEAPALKAPSPKKLSDATNKQIDAMLRQLWVKRPDKSLGLSRDKGVKPEWRNALAAQGLISTWGMVHARYRHDDNEYLRGMVGTGLARRTSLSSLSV